MGYEIYHFEHWLGTNAVLHHRHINCMCRKFRAYFFFGVPIRMLSKSSGHLLSVRAVIHVLFHLENDEPLPNTTAPSPIEAAIDFVEVCCQHTAYNIRHKMIDHELEILEAGIFSSLNSSNLYQSWYCLIGSLIVCVTIDTQLLDTDSRSFPGATQFSVTCSLCMWWEARQGLIGG